MVDSLLLDESHGNIANRDNRDISGSSKIDSSGLYPSYSSNKNSDACINYVLGSPQGMVTLLLSGLAMVDRPLLDRSN